MCTNHVKTAIILTYLLEANTQSKVGTTLFPPITGRDMTLLPHCVLLSQLWKNRGGERKSKSKYLLCLAHKLFEIEGLEILSLDKFALLSLIAREMEGQEEIYLS